MKLNENGWLWLMHDREVSHEITTGEELEALCEPIRNISLPTDWDQ